MPKRSGLTISKRTVDGLSVADREAVFWDREVPGFGVRVYPSGRKVYVVQSRGPSGLRRVSLGQHGELAPEQARRKAIATIERIKRGDDAVPAPVFTVADLAERYMEAHVRVRCNAHTQGVYRGSLDNHILPALGDRPVVSVERADAAALHYGLRATPHAANRALMVLSRMFNLAEAWGLVPPGTNPCLFVIRYRAGMRERFLSQEEYRRVGRALCELELRGPLPTRAVAALRLLMLTGCRVGEVLSLRWDDIDRGSGELRLRDSKTGARMVALTPAALCVLTGLRRHRRSPWVFAARDPKRHLSALTDYWRVVRQRAGVEDVRIHDLRHSFASRALALGEGLTMIGRLLGHTDFGSTARYAHLARDAERIAVTRVGDSIEADMLRLDAAKVGSVVDSAA